MKFTVNRSDLTDALKLAKPQRPGSLPILNTFAIIPGKGHVAVRSTDLECWASIPVKASAVSGNDTMIVDYNDLYRATQGVADTAISFNSTQGKATLTHQKGKIDFVAFDSDEYPDMPEVHGKTLSINGDDLLRALERTIHAVSIDETKHNLCSSLLEVNANTKAINVIATDGHRLAKMQIGKKMRSEKTIKSFFISKSIQLKLIAALKKNPTAAVTVGTDKSKVSNIFTFNGHVFVSRYDAVFPDYRRVIPEKSGKTTLLSKGDLKETLSRASKVARSRNVKLDFEDGKVIIRSTNNEGPKTEEELKARCDQKIAIAFSVDYLNDIIKGVEANSVGFNISTSVNPCIILDPATPEYAEVLMPARL